MQLEVNRCNAPGRLVTGFEMSAANSLFIPFSEELMAATGGPPGDLVPYQRSFRCVRLFDGTYEFSLSDAQDQPEVLQKQEPIGQAA